MVMVIRQVMFSEVIAISSSDHHHYHFFSLLFALNQAFVVHTVRDFGVNLTHKRLSRVILTKSQGRIRNRN